MNSFENLFICLHLIVVFVCVQSEQPLNRNKRYEEVFTVTADEETPQTLPVEIQCTRRLKKESNSLHIQSLCRPPRKRLVPVKMPSMYYMPGVYHLPNMYEVDRCDGVCQHPNHRCLPIKTEFIEVPTHSRLIAGPQTSGRSEKCMSVKIEKHLLCGCQCSMTEENCNDKQVFSQDRCACECTDTSKAKTCSQLNRMWSNEKCDCICPPSASRECSSGALFDEESCRCLQTKR